MPSRGQDRRNGNDYRDTSRMLVILIVPRKHPLAAERQPGEKLTQLGIAPLGRAWRCHAEGVEMSRDLTERPPSIDDQGGRESNRASFGRVDDQSSVGHVQTLGSPSEGYDAAGPVSLDRNLTTTRLVALNNQVSLELREGPKNVAQQATLRCRGVEVAVNSDELDACVAQFSDEGM